MNKTKSPTTIYAVCVKSQMKTNKQKPAFGVGDTVFASILESSFTYMAYESSLHFWL